MKKLYLVDVSSLFFRAFYAVRPLSNSKGLPTNAIYGFLSMITKLLRESKPDYLAFCYDTPEPSFREEIDPNYKAHRTEMPDDLQPQIPYIEKIAEALNICSLRKIGYEADDLIGSLAQLGLREGVEVVIVSGDKDFCQLVKPHLSMYDTMKEVRLDERGVVEKYGVQPAQFIDYLAIVGDASDNVPGVAGIGPKGAVKLLTQFGSLEAIYQNLDKIEGKSVLQKLKDGREDAFLSRKLVCIVTDLDTGHQLADFKLKSPNRDELQKLLIDLEFRSMERFLVDHSDTPAAPVVNHSTNRPHAPIAESQVQNISLDQVKPLFSQTSSAWAISSGGGVSLGIGPNLYHVEGEPSQIGLSLKDVAVRWKGFDLKEIWKAMKLSNPLAEWDHMLAAYVLRSGAIRSFADLCKLYLNEDIPPLANAAQLYRLHQQLENVLRDKLAEFHGSRVFEQIEMPLVPVLYKMERHGVLIDRALLKKQSQELARDIGQLEKSICKIAGQEFNIASPKQLAFILFEKMMMPRGRRTKTGYSTDEDVLEKLAADFPIVREILQYRELTKLKSTYVDALQQLADPKTDRVHTTFNQALTATGRLSSVNPNLQNIPIRTNRGNAIREAFIAAPDHVLIAADYSQIELRILAHISEDQGLCEAFAEDRDIHAATASLVFDKPEEEITPDLRRMAKAVNFGIAYGQGPYGLAENLAIGRSEADQIIKQYFARFPKVHDYMESTIESAKKNGYVETLFGRRRYLDELRSSNQAIRKFGERAAINAPIQGTASDLVKIAMIQVDSQIDVPMLLQVHDELIFEAPKSKAAATGEHIQKLMEGAVQLRVPLKINIGIGKNWAET